MKANDELLRAEVQYKQLLVAHEARLHAFTEDALIWIGQMEDAHQNFYNALMKQLEESGEETDFEQYVAVDKRCMKQLSALQAASERIVEASAHIGRSIKAK